MTKIYQKHIFKTIYSDLFLSGENFLLSCMRAYVYVCECLFVRAVTSQPYHVHCFCPTTLSTLTLSKQN